MRSSPRRSARGHLLPGEFEDVLEGLVPGTEIRLGRMREGEHDHRPGWDITCSAPKSVSLEALVIGDRRVIRAHYDAVTAGYPLGENGGKSCHGDGDAGGSEGGGSAGGRVAGPGGGATRGRGDRHDLRAADGR